MSENEPNSIATGQPPEALFNAIKKILRPVVRLLLHHQITYPTLINLLKSLYVEVADEEFKVDNKRQSDSRITLLTGVHRKDIKRIRSEDNIDTLTPKSISIGAQLIATWLGSDDFLAADGTPRPLALKSSDNDSTKGFDDLVALVCKQDIRPRVILDEWLNLGIAHVDEDKCVVLNTGAFTPDQGFEEKLFFFGKNIHDHVSASTHNLLGNKPSYFDRSVYYDQLSAQSIALLRDEANQIGMLALNTMNKRALALQSADQNRPDAHYRMNFGVFNYSREYTPSSTDKDGNNDA